MMILTDGCSLWVQPQRVQTRRDVATMRLQNPLSNNEPYHDVFPSWPAPPGLASGIRADQRSSKMASGSCFACCTQRASELRKEQVFVSIAGCADSQRRRCDLSRTTAFSHHGRHLQALPAAFARTSEAQRWLQEYASPAVHSERASCEKSRFLCRLLAAQPAGDAVMT